MEDAPVVAPTIVANLRSVTVCMSSSAALLVSEVGWSLGTSAVLGIDKESTAPITGRRMRERRPPRAPTIVVEEGMQWWPGEPVSTDVSYTSEADPAQIGGESHSDREEERKP